MKNRPTTTTLSISRTGLTALIGLGAASSANAIIQTGAAISVSGNEIKNWNIDGDANDEFRLRALTSSSSDTGRINIFIRPGGLGELATNGGGNVAGLTASAVVDVNYAFRTSVEASSNSNSGSDSFGLASISQSTPTVIGFSFQRSGATHYGIATFSYVANDNPSASISMTDVFWNDVAGEGITGAGTAVPEPATTAIGLGALALGAVGLRRWRKAK